MAASGIGSVAGTWIARWKARAEADVTRIKAEGEADALLTRAESQKQAMELITDAQLKAKNALDDTRISIKSKIDMQEEIHSRIIFQEEKRQSNIQSVLLSAAEELGEKSVEQTEIDHDWTARFFADVMDVSSVEMQRIWGKILAGEVESPGQTSLKTLSILKQLSQREAQLFQNAAKFITQDFILNDSMYTKDIPEFPTDPEFMLLSHYGLVQIGSSLSMVLNAENNENLIFDKNQVFRIHREAESKHELTIPCHSLSSSGTELYNVVDVQISDEYLGALSTFLDINGGWTLSYANTLTQLKNTDTILKWQLVSPLAKRNK